MRRTDVRVYQGEALALLRKSDVVFSDGNLVRFPAGLIERALEQAQSCTALCKHGSHEAVAPLEGYGVNFGPDSD